MGIYAINFYRIKSPIESINPNASESLFKNDRLPITHSKLPFNFRSGEAKHCLENLVYESDLNNARDEIKRKLDIGQSSKEEYKQCIIITSA